jgi:hypothetical protein
MKLIYIILSLVALLAGCNADNTALEPVWGKQPCAHCHMLLSDPSNAGQLVTIAGERLYFDDVGCLVEQLLDEPGTVARAWVRDAGGHWVHASSARYERGLETPMGYGFAPRAAGSFEFADLQREVAQRRLARSGP